MADPTVHPDSRPPVIVVAGPTAAGKTGIAIELAERIGAEIVSADSMQVYRHLDIGTAKPTVAERGRIPHHLIDVVTPDIPYSAGRYLEDARAAAAKIHERGMPVVLTGGTGLYVRAMLEGLVPAGGADPALRQEFEDRDRKARAEGDPGWLHRYLAERDPERARELHPNDVVRLIRAIEVFQRAGGIATPRADAAVESCPYRVLHLAIDPGRDALNERIDLRCDAMIEAGLLNEVRGLRSKGYGPDLRPLQAIGYRHMHTVVEGTDTLVNAVAEMKRDTRRFARRQRTWLRAVEGLVWLEPDEEKTLTMRVERFLGESREAGWEKEPA